MLSAWIARLRALSADKAALGSALMAVAIIVGNGISFVSLPLLARLYSPEAFGNFGFVIAWTTILGVVFTLRFEAIIPITSSTTAAAALARRAATRTMALSLLLAAVLWISVTAGWIYDAITPTELLVGIGAAFAASYFALGRSLHQRLDQYRIIAASTILRSVVFVGTALILAFLAGSTAFPGGAALLMASMLSFLIPGLVYHATTRSPLRRALLPGRKLDSHESNFSNGALQQVSANFILSQISFQFPLWMAMLLFGSTAAGWVTMSYRLAMFPSDILCGSVSLVLARRIADSVFHHPERLAADRRLLALFLVGNFILFGLLGLFIWMGAGMLLGKEWADAALEMGLMASIGLSFTIQPTVIQVLGLLNRAAESLWITIAHIVMLAGGALLVWLWGVGLEAAIIGLAGLEILLSGCLTFYVLRVTKAAASNQAVESS